MPKAEHGHGDGKVQTTNLTLADGVLRDLLRIEHAVDRLLSKFQEMESAADRISQKTEVLMATVNDFDTLFEAIGTETDRIAAKFQEMLDKIGAGGITDAEEAAEIAKGQALVDRLKAIGADVADPVPDPLPEPPTP